MVINIQSILSKKELFWQTLNYHKPDVVFGCETRLNQSTLDSEILPPSYKLFQNDPVDGYGGVLIGVNTGLASHLIDVPSHIECCAVSSHSSNNQQIILICVYSSQYRCTIPRKSVQLYY